LRTYADFDDLTLPYAFFEVLATTKPPTPLPLTSPGFESDLKKYNGSPL
jgi:hypothetical protein